MISAKLKKINELFSRCDFFTAVRIILLKIFIKTIFPQVNFFFSQESEDVQILSLLHYKKNGFYIDIGSNDPIANSNTFKLYLLGWNGILVDGNEALVKKAKKTRKKDICINKIISKSSGKLKFYVSANHEMSSIDEMLANRGSESQRAREVEVEAATIDSIIQEHVPPGVLIDLLSIDVEGHDFDVLQSIDLTKYAPTIIVLEDLNHWQIPVRENTIVQYLGGFGYTLISKDRLNLYFQKPGGNPM